MKNIHKYLGLVMLLPFIAWTITGIFFFLKPGYKVAYQALPITQYPLQALVHLPEHQKWLEVRQLKTILGAHVLVKNDQGWQQLSPVTFQPIEKANQQQITQLINDAIKHNRERYGEIAKIEENVITTNNNIRITLDWHNLSLHQKGADTDFINTMYSIHYLQWTGVKSIDKFLGVIGLLLVTLLAIFGLLMSLKKKPDSQ
ncbi:PepSY domain-containing protein [Colwelliaceae bacterium 6441]